ncbi:RNA polymerase sigma-70 factor, partial [Bacteroidales bacterium OttesenSCG-928-A17]|nr:RNA polymerase sigma-70 factor [Bacteroidales bacterium OttesenSCG-928-A17]
MKNIYLHNKEIFKQIFSDFYLSLCLFSERYLNDKEEAADVAQNTLIKLWQKREDFENYHQIKKFLYTTAKNQCLNELDHRRVVEEYSRSLGEKEKEKKDFFFDHVIEQETHRILVNAIKKLPPQTSKVMMLALSGKGNKEIAEKLQISDGTVHTHKKIAYKRLREELKDYFYILL